ncbi:hypothetical protein [Endozoicomonas sp. SCSIO W0465]|uniref:hypothetical protein n=1 Tax=Endozoicomonas sp. SCSIO W0465 TaxID=2918516 RepID=UPI002074CCDD|nr:hypothetical protein [Endozoicomonas sp. SCSIO W0465]USE35650.1 hypothetical protein MJO57_26840 [Endozoicomonas sp. SCSIO W0465]
MNGVGGHQPINLAPIANNDKTQGTNKSEGSFGGFKVTIPKTIKAFLSSIFSTRPSSPSIQTRQIQLHTPSQPSQQHSSNIENNGSNKPAEGNLGEALALARENSNIKSLFTQLHDKLEEMQTSKHILQGMRHRDDSFIACTVDVQQSKASFIEAVKSFNQNVSADLQIDADDLEMAMANKDAPESAKDLAKLEVMKKALYKA